VVAFQLTLVNESAVDEVEVVALVDDLYGDLAGQGTCALPQTLAPSESYSCHFISVVDGAVPSVEIDRATAVAAAVSGGAVAVAQDSAIVLLLGAPPTALEIPTASGAGLALLALLLAALAVWRIGAGAGRD
jgi:hypothetical protein